MNGFTYDEQKKEIIIKDGANSIIWQNVENNIAQKASELFNESKNIDDYLKNNNCIRFYT